MSVLSRLLTAAVSRLLAFRARPQAIRNALPRTVTKFSPPGSQVRVGAVQMSFEFVRDGAQYARLVYGLAKQAADRGAQLVVFPEYAWTPLLGMLPNIGELEKKSHGGLAGATTAGDTDLRELFLYLAPHVETAFIATGSAVARALGIYLMSGTTISRGSDTCLYNVAHLFAPDGLHVGAQKKLHTFTTERAWLNLGDDLRTFDLGFTRAAVPVCMDFTYWETTRLAFQEGAEILINPSADYAAEQEYLQARGVRTRVQEVPCFGILANMVTDLFGLHWRGPSLIVQPTELGNSIVAHSETTDHAEVVVAELDLERLRAYRKSKHWDPNRTLLHDILPRAYAAHAAK